MSEPVRQGRRALCPLMALADLSFFAWCDAWSHAVTTLMRARLPRRWNVLARLASRFLDII